MRVNAFLNGITVDHTTALFMSVEDAFTVADAGTDKFSRGKIGVFGPLLLEPSLRWDFYKGFQLIFDYQKPVDLIPGNVTTPTAANVMAGIEA
jgi:hypothetical protein